MGLSGQLKDMVKEYNHDPSGQYKRHLKKLLDLHTTGSMTKKEVLLFVREWAGEKP